MNDRVRRILDQIATLDNELQAAPYEQQKRLLYEIKGRRVEFEQSILETHLRLRMGVIRWLLTIRPRNLLTAPIIYGMIVPLLLFDACVAFCQLTCFPIYGIPKAKRRDYIVFDHQYLAYLNIFEKLN
jgi:hypothetical protein